MSDSQEHSGASDTDRQSCGHASAVAAQLRQAEENGTLIEEMEDDHTIRPAQDLVCPVCEEYRGTDEAAMGAHLRRDHDGAGRWGPELLADGGDERDLRAVLLDAAEAYDSERFDLAESALQQALSDVRRARQAHLAEVSADD
jgi:hypothetical protein